MLKPTDYTPTRRYLMQAVMMVILGGSIALAAAVGSAVRRANRVELKSDATVRKEVSVRLPVGWNAQPRSDDRSVVAQAQDSASDRTLTVRVERLDAPLSPLQHLIGQIEFPTSGSRREYRLNEDEPIVTIPMAGQTGVMMVLERGSRSRSRRQGSAAAAVLHKEVVAAVVLPSRRGVVVHLKGSGALEQQDIAAVEQVAGAIEVANEPELAQPGSGVTLPEGIRFDAPRGLVPVVANDPKRTDRLLWPVAALSSADVESLEGGWMTIETVGCLAPDFDADDPKQLERAKDVISTLLLVRDPQLWRDATITAIGNRVWRADPVKSGADDASSAFPARAYLLTHPTGRALLAVFRGGLGETNFESSWKELVRSVTFLAASDAATLEDVGTAEASRLRQIGYEKLLADRDLEWWLWSDGEEHIGWSNVEFAADELAGTAERRLRLARGDAVGRVRHEFSYRNERPQYRSMITREVIGERAVRPAVASTALEGGVLSMSAGTEAAEERPQAAGRQIEAPPQFVPGALLPLVMGDLAPEPMVLRTDSFPGLEQVGPTGEPLLIIIRPDSAAAPLRGLTVQVNGTGEMSRWFFRETGELERVEWPLGIQQVASDESAVRNNFPNDGLMSP